MKEYWGSNDDLHIELEEQLKSVPQFEKVDGTYITYPISEIDGKSLIIIKNDQIKFLAPGSIQEAIFKASN